jgi:hypothetical protein
VGTQKWVTTHGIEASKKKNTTRNH